MESSSIEAKIYEYITKKEQKAFFFTAPREAEQGRSEDLRALHIFKY